MIETINSPKKLTCIYYNILYYIFHISQTFFNAVIQEKVLEKAVLKVRSHQKRIIYSEPQSFLLRTANLSLVSCSASSEIQFEYMSIRWICVCATSRICLNRVVGVLPFEPYALPARPAKHLHLFTSLHRLFIYSRCARIYLAYLGRVWLRMEWFYEWSP